METRLAETERALFFALAEIHAGAVVRENYESPSVRQAMGPSVLLEPTPTTQQDKARLMASWARSPLTDREQAHAWFEANRGEDSVHSYVSPNANMTTGVDTITPSNSGIVISANSDRPVAHIGPSSRIERDSNDGFVAETPQRSRHMASVRQGDLSDSHPAMPSFSGSRNEGDTPPARDVAQTSKASSFAKANTNVYF